MKNLKARAIALLNSGIDRLQATFPPNRLVVLLTPVFVPLAGAASAWIATNFPGIALSEGTVVGFAAAGSLAAIGGAYKWLDKWQKQELGEVSPAASVETVVDGAKIETAVKKATRKSAGLK
jgi:hypothetical protein